MNETGNKNYIFESMKVPKALAVMAFPTVVSQVIVLLYNLADTWFIGRTNNPYMIGAASLVLGLYLSMAALSNIFGVGGGSLMVRLMGKGKNDEALHTEMYSIMMTIITGAVFSVLCLVLMDPILYLLGASDNTLEYSRQYMLFTVVLGSIPTMLSMSMPMLMRNAGYAKEAGFGVSLGGILNILLDPLFMFVILPEGYEVMGAAIATMTANYISLGYFIVKYIQIHRNKEMQPEKKFERITRDSVSSFYSVGIPAAVILLLFNFVGIVLNRLAAAHSDIALSSVGIILKVERLPQNIGLGVCLGMVPLIGYNYAKKNWKRMDSFFSAARICVLIISIVSAVSFYLFAEPIVHTFLDVPETVSLGTRFLKARCFAIPFMLLSFQIINFMQAADHGKVSFLMSIIRHLLLNIPIMIIFDAIWGIDGLIWAQTVSDILNAAVSYLLYFKVHKKITSPIVS